MKLITFINRAYVSITYNLYLQLKQFNLHKNLLIYASSDKTFDDLSKLNLKCDIKKYTPLLFKDSYHPDLCSDNFSKCGHGDTSYTSLQFLKHDCLYQTLLDNKYVCLLDADILVFANFIENLKKVMDTKHKFGYDTTSLFGFKYYLNVNVATDLNSSNLYGWCGKHHIINTGFMSVYYSNETFNMIEEYCNLFTPHFSKNSTNLDEHILTKYFSNKMVNVCSITDNINTLSNSGYIYTPDEIKILNCDTFHPTFANIDKVEFIKQCGRWLVD